MESLYALNALDEEGMLTRLGRRMAEFPLEPPMSKILIASVELALAIDTIRTALLPILSKATNLEYTMAVKSSLQPLAVMFRSGSHHRSHALSPKHLVPPKGEAGPG
eukprot:scaffold23069_cov36-Tisochrysis_lutea.AAC.4